MESTQDLIRIQMPLQVGSELRIKNSGEISLGNEQQEPAQNARAADAVLLYHLDPHQEMHIIHLPDPVVDHKHHRA